MNADEVLVMADVRTLPVDPTAVARFFGIRVASYQECESIFGISRAELYRVSRFGFTFRDGEGYVCAVNENACGERRRRWTAAHELGHCMLGHVSGGEPNERQEREADRFAAELLAPLTVLHFCGVGSAGEIAVVCGISAQAGQYRFAELTRLRRSGAERFRSWRVSAREEEAPNGCLLSSRADMRLFMQFSGFIGQHIYENTLPRAAE